jgi:hypothetical protein
VSVFQELERYVPPGHLDEWRQWVAYTSKYETTDEIGHICQAAGWLALLTCETPSNLAEHNNRFLEAISARFSAEQAQRTDLQKAITILTETLEDELGKLPTSAKTANDELTAGINKNIGRLRSEVDKLKAMRLTTWGGSLFLAWAFGILTQILISLVFHF